MSVGGGEQWQRVAALPPTTTRYTVPDLSHDHAYRFRLYTDTYDHGLSAPVLYDAPDRAPARTGTVPSTMPYPSTIPPCHSQYRTPAPLCHCTAIVYCCSMLYLAVLYYRHTFSHSVA
jgi:hypothetical protein